MKLVESDQKCVIFLGEAIDTLIQWHNVVAHVDAEIVFRVELCGALLVDRHSVLVFDRQWFQATTE